MKLLATLLLALVCLGASAQQPDDWFTHYTDGRAVIMRDSLYGFIDRQGREVIPCQYKKAYNFNNGIAMVRSGNEAFAIDTMGNRLDYKVHIPQFHNRDFENFVYYVWRRIPFASSGEYEQFRNENVYALITIDLDGSIASCELLQASSAAAYAKVRDVVLDTPRWSPGTVDGEPCRISYMLPVEFHKLHPVSCFPLDDNGQRIEGDFTYALFQGGYAYGFYAWFFKNLKFKDADQYHRAQSGLVRALFTIDAKGTLGDIEVVRSHNDVCRDKLLETLKRSPRWTPGQIDGKPVAVRYDMSFYFSFR